MKVCPVCGTVFDGSEIFCPHDGARLFTTTNEVGAWKGKTLDDVVEIEHLLFVDELGERYLGKLVGKDVRVKVTLFNMVTTPTSENFKSLEMTQAIMETPLPKELTQIIVSNAEHDPPYLIENAPAGPTLRQLLNEQEHLDWKTAIKLTNNLARVMEWMSKLGVVHRAIHPHAIHVTNIKAGHICVSEWGHGVLHYHDNALEAARAKEVVPYSAYMAPEQTDDASQADGRSMIYSLAMLMYEILAGVPPYFGQESEDILKRHRRERPPKLSISSQDKTLGTTLDEIFELISNRMPEERFQTPLALINALTSSLDGQSQSDFPELNRDGENITIGEDVSDDASSQEEDGGKKTLLFINAEEIHKAALEAQETENAEKEAQRKATQGTTTTRKKKKRRRKSTKTTPDTTSESVTVDDASAPTTQMDTSVLEADKKKEPVVLVEDPEAQNEREDNKQGSSKVIIADDIDKQPTSVAGSSSTQVDDASSETLIATPDTTKTKKKRRRRTKRKPSATNQKSTDTNQVSSVESKETSENKSDVNEKTSEEASVVVDKKVEDSTTKEDSSTDAKTDAKTKPKEVKDQADVKKEDKTDDAPEVVEADKPATNTNKSTSTKRKRRRKKPATSKTSPSKDAAAPESEKAPTPEKTKTDKKEAVTTAAKTKPKAETKPSAKPPEDASKEDFDQWFATSTDNAWDQSYLEEHSQRTEKKYRSILITIFIIFAIILGIAIYYFQFVAPDRAKEEEAMHQQYKKQSDVQLASLYKQSDQT